MWWLKLKLLGLRYWLHCVKLKAQRRKYCAKGLHKLTNGRTTFNIGGKVGNCEYLTCCYCNYKFFSSVKAKTRFNNLVDGFDNRLKTAVSDLAKHSSCAKQTHFKGKGKCKARDVSARVDVKQNGVDFQVKLKSPSVDLPNHTMTCTGGKG